MKSLTFEIMATDVKMYKKTAAGHVVTLTEDCAELTSFRHSLGLTLGKKSSLVIITLLLLL